MDEQEDDGPDDADLLIMSIFHDMNRGIVRGLLRGSDVQCFSTAQYFEARRKYLMKAMSKPALEYFTMRNARTQLEALHDTVREVKPGVWVAV